MLDDLSSALSGWIEAQTEVETAKEKRDEYATVLEHYAYTILKDRHAFRRTGQRPRLREVENGDLYFSITNGMDYGDDFSAHFTLAELEAEGGDRLFHPSEYEKR